MASEQLKKVLEIIRSQPVGGGSGKPTVERMRSGMEKVAERVASDVSCELVEAGGVKAEWIVPPGAAADRAILYLHHLIPDLEIDLDANQLRALGDSAVDDATAGFRWLLAQGYKSDKIAIGGTPRAADWPLPP
jgi:epsilon-lactone hydrolase